MLRIKTPESIQAAPSAAQDTLKAVEKMLGQVPNMFRLISNSPETLNGYVALNTALGAGKLDAKTRERIALAVAEANKCNYCLAAHSFLGENVAKLAMDEILSARSGKSSDAKADKAVKFAVKVVKERGQVHSTDLEDLRNVGYSDAEIVEIVGHVALNTLTNYMNEVFKTEIDFPEARDLA